MNLNDEAMNEERAKAEERAKQLAEKEDEESKLKKEKEDYDTIRTSGTHGITFPSTQLSIGHALFVLTFNGLVNIISLLTALLDKTFVQLVLLLGAEVGAFSLSDAMLGETAESTERRSAKAVENFMIYVRGVFCFLM